VPWQVSGDVQLPQTWVPPQPFETVPQFLPEQAVAFALGVQPHTFGVPPPPQVCGEVQASHVCMPPQPFGTEPHLPAQAVALTVGTHWHLLGEPLQASLLAQAVQRDASAQPLLASVVTHLSPHFLVPGPQVPIAQVDP
jgi:hypothetical protein